MTIEAAFQAICERPEDDDARLRYADLVEPSDPDHATYIRLTIADAIRRRHGIEAEHRETRGSLLNRNEERWAHNLSRFLPRCKTRRGIETEGLWFDRGFPTQIQIHPYVFLEYADLLFRLAPIRHVRFTVPYGQDDLLPGPIPTLEDGTLEQFPIDKILAMPQLSRLDSFGFDRDSRWESLLPRDTWARVAKCPYLTRCRVLDTGRFNIYASIDELAAGPHTGKMIRIEETNRHSNPISQIGEYRHDEFDNTNGGHTVTSFADRGKALERKYGYIPWLHPSHCANVDLYDIPFLVADGELPKYKPGTPPMDEWYEFPIEIHARQPSHPEW